MSTLVGLRPVAHAASAAPGCGAAGRLASFVPRSGGGGPPLLRPFRQVLGRGPAAAPPESPATPAPGLVRGRDPAPHPRDGEREREREERLAVDPAARHAAQLGPPPVFGAMSAEVPAVAGAAQAARVSIEELVPQLVRRIAWAGDRRRGSAVLELAAGPWAGTTVTVHADDGRIRIELQGRGTEPLGARLAERLARRGIDVESVT
jgi:hypothetical protein